MAQIARNRGGQDWLRLPGNPPTRLPRFPGDNEEVTRVSDLTGYREYVGSRLEPLRRTAYLLCGDWHTADDLVSTALVKLLRHWPRGSAMDTLDAYVRRTLRRVWLDERRRPWRREAAWAEVPDHPA